MVGRLRGVLIRLLEGLLEEGVQKFFEGVP